MAAVAVSVSFYTYSLLTIGDDEFFSLSSTSSTVSRNPLTIDDLVAFSRQLLHIAFLLYWFEDQAKVKEGGPEGVKFTGEKVRELISSCLKRIHAREWVVHRGFVLDTNYFPVPGENSHLQAIGLSHHSWTSILSWKPLCKT